MSGVVVSGDGGAFLLGVEVVISILSIVAGAASIPLIIGLRRHSAESTRAPSLISLMRGTTRFVD